MLKVTQDSQANFRHPYSGSIIYLDICDLVKGGGEVLDYVSAERLDVLNLDELKHLQRNGYYKHKICQDYAKDAMFSVAATSRMAELRRL